MTSKNSTPRGAEVRLPSVSLLCFTLEELRADQTRASLWEHSETVPDHAVPVVLFLLEEEPRHPSACALFCCKNLCCATRFCTGGRVAVQIQAASPAATKQRGAQSEGPRGSWEPENQQHSGPENQDSQHKLNQPRGSFLNPAVPSVVF